MGVMGLMFLSPNEMTEITESLAFAGKSIIHFLYFCGTNNTIFLLAIFRSRRNDRNTQKV
jgi:hypothetical protein